MQSFRNSSLPSFPRSYPSLTMVSSSSSSFPPLPLFDLLCPLLMHHLFLLFLFIFFSHPYLLYYPSIPTYSSIIPLPAHFNYCSVILLFFTLPRVSPFLTPLQLFLSLLISFTHPWFLLSPVSSCCFRLLSSLSRPVTLLFPPSYDFLNPPTKDLNEVSCPSVLHSLTRVMFLFLNEWLTCSLLAFLTLLCFPLPLDLSLPLLRLLPCFHIFSSSLLPSFLHGLLLVPLLLHSFSIPFLSFSVYSIFSSSPFLFHLPPLVFLSLSSPSFPP